MRSALLVPLAVVVANLAATATSIVIPRFLEPSEYSIFAIGWASGIFATSFAYDWLRFAVLRYAVTAELRDDIRTREILLLGYVVITALLALASLALFVASLANTALAVTATIIFYAICQGAFDGRQSLARAELDHRTFSFSWISRTILSLVFAIGLAWATKSGKAALAGLAASYLVVLVSGSSHRANFATRLSQVNWVRAKQLASYGGFAALATTFATILPAIARSIAGHELGLTSAAGTVLALDLSQKAVIVVGLAVNVITMQSSIRAMEFGDLEEQIRRVRNHISLTCAFILPAATGFYLVQDPFARLFVPHQYMPTYLASVGWSTFCAALYVLRIYTVDTLFVIAGNARLGVIGPAASCVVSVGAIIALGNINGYTYVSICQGLAVGLTVGILISASVSRAVLSVGWPIRDLFAICLACAAMALAVAVTPKAPGAMSNLALELVVGATVYMASALVMNVANLRSIAMEAGARFFTAK